MKSKENINKLIDKLIHEGEDIRNNPWKDKQFEAVGIVKQYVELERFKKWIGSFNLLLSLLGHLGKPWKDVYDENKKVNSFENTLSVLGTLKSIKESIDDGLLIRFEDLVYAEAFSNLVEQSEYLYGQGYFLAAGVILRAILEERLKKLCEQNGCLPGKKRPTINDCNQNLYKANIYDKITFKNVDSMASVGNAAAHNDPKLDKLEIERFLRDLPQFLMRFSV